MRMLEPKVSIVVVSFNTREKLRRCLTCIEAKHEVIVVDNASLDGSAEMVRQEFPQVKLLCNTKNIGFGPANNLGCSAATSDLVLFLNSDAYADPGAIDLLASVFEDIDVVGAGGMLLNPDRSLQLSTANRLNLWAVFCEQTLLEKVFKRSKVLSPYWSTLRLAQTDEPSTTFQVMGACLMVRAHRGMPVELFDARYFLYCEDTDLCRRLELHGRLLYVPKAKFVHDLGSSSSRDPSLGIIRYNRGKELYFKIHHGTLPSIVCLLMDRVGALIRLLGWSAKYALTLFRGQRAKGQLVVFWRVLTAAHRNP